MAYSGNTLISASVINASERGMSRSESSAPQPSRNAAPTIARPESSETNAGLKACALSVSARKSHGNGTTAERIRGRYFFICLSAAEKKSRRNSLCIYHFPYYICHLPLPVVVAALLTMANDKCNMENGKCKDFKIFS